MDESPNPETLDFTELVEIVILITEAKIMKGQRNEPFISFVTVETGDNILAGSDHCDLKEDNTFQYNLTFKLQAFVGDYYKIDDFICKPLLRQEFMITQRYVMEFFEAPKVEPPIQPDIELKISFTNGLLGQELLRQCNIIQLTLESCYSIPDELIVNNKPDDLFIAGCSLPLLEEAEEEIVFRFGILVRNSKSHNAHEEKKWYTANAAATGKALYIADSCIQTGTIEDDNGDFQDENDREFRHNLETNFKERIIWNTEFRSLISPTANLKLIQKIRQYKYLPLEFARITTGSKKKEMGYNAVAYVNLTPILFPGTTTIHGAYQLHPLSLVEMKAKTNKTSIFVHGTPSRQGSAFIASILQKRSLGREDITDKQKTETSPSLESPGLIEGIYSEEAVAFEGKHTYITLTISLLHPLVQQRLPEEIRLKVSELIPNRNLTFLKVDSAQKAVDEFGTQVCNTAALLLEDYKTLLIKDAGGSQTKDRLTTQDYRKTKFMHELKKNGKYFACKEQLKYHVVKIVRDKFLRRSNFDSAQEFEEFLSTLYVYLIEEMHKSLNKYFAITDPVAVPDQVSGLQELKTHAADAFAIGRYDLAEKYNQHRIQRFTLDSAVWVDYGIYCLGVGNQEKAAECFRHALSLDNDHFRGLLLYGMVCDICGRSDQTEIFLQHAVNTKPSSALAHTILGLYYHGIGNSIGADCCYKDALDLISGKILGKALGPTESSLSIMIGDDQLVSDESSIFLSSLPFLFNCNATLYAQRALAQDLTAYQCTPHGNYHLFLAKLRYQEGDYNLAEIAIRDALERDNINADVWSLSGHIQFALGNKNKAKQNYIRALTIQKPPLDLHIIYYKLGLLGLDSKDYDRAKKNFLLTCKYSPSCLSWIGVGKACYFLEDYIEAEEAFSEANILDNTDPEVWGYLTLVALKTGREDEVEQAYRFCCKHELKDKKLLDEIHNLSHEVGISLTPV